MTEEGKKDSLEYLGYATKYSLDKIWVVYSAKYNSVLHDPMTNKPVFNIRRELLFDIAKQFKGRIVTAKQAINLLLAGKPQ